MECSLALYGKVFSLRGTACGLLSPPPPSLGVQVCVAAEAMLSGLISSRFLRAGDEMKRTLVGEGGGGGALWWLGGGAHSGGGADRDEGVKRGVRGKVKHTLQHYICLYAC